MKKYAQKVLSIIKHAFKKRPLLMKIIVVILTALILNQSIALFTKVNVIEVGVKKLLAAVDIYLEEVKEVEFASDGWDSKEPGSWKIYKEAEWTGVDTAKIVIYFDTEKKLYDTEEEYNKVILVVDNSLSMENDEKMDRAKEQSINLINNYLDDEKNQMAIVSFDDVAQIVTSFTNNKETLINGINSLTPKGNTNYYDALKKVDNLMASNALNKGVIVLFLTDGIPCVDTPNEIAMYKSLKEKYPNLFIKGVQYEMGNEVSSALKKISDSQEIADKETLGDIFYNATVFAEKYEKFDITDYIDDRFFYVKSEDDIEYDKGTVELIKEENGRQKVVWSLGPDLVSGIGYNNTKSRLYRLTINVTLKDEYVNDKNKDYYPTNKNVSVTTKLPSTGTIVKEKLTTPVLKRIYNITYDSNAPSGCNLKNIKKDTFYALGKANVSADDLFCKGYLFKGWDIAEDDVKKISDNLFIMPTHDVTLRGIWTKQSIVKTMEGEVIKKINLYEQVKYDAENELGASSFYGSVTDTYNNTLENQTIYYYTSPNNNNVLFGGFCWQMVRTTANKGVKMVYNGLPTDNGQCFNYGESTTIGSSPYNEMDSSTYSSNKVGYMYDKSAVYQYYTFYNLTDTMVYANDVTWDGNKYQLIDTRNSWDNTHHYTCFQENNLACDKVYYGIDLTGYNGLGDFPTYIVLENGKTINDALYDMIGYRENEEKPINKKLNTDDSAVKKMIDDWYSKNMTNYTKYLDDVVYCGDRSVNRGLGGWNKDTNYGHAYLGAANNFSCPQILDQFSTSNELAKLTYPVGLLTHFEAEKMGLNLGVGIEYWVNGQIALAETSSVLSVDAEGTTGGGSYAWLRESLGVRPAITLKEGTTYIDGNGTQGDPYQIYMD